jgi:tRNA A37 threonylcarbamoyladenosine biosynthesis protein TsaE
MLIEWSENGGRCVPPPDLELTLSYAGPAGAR